MSRLLCVDVGIANIGAFVVDLTAKEDDGRHFAHEFAYLHTEKSEKKLRWRHSDDRARRIAEAARFYADIIKRHDIKRVAAELPTGGAPNSAAATDLAAAGSCLITAAEIHNCACSWFTAKEAKKALTGDPGASKKAVMDSAGAAYPRLLELYPAQAQREHVSDAVAIWFAARHDLIARL